MGELRERRGVKNLLRDIPNQATEKTPIEKATPPTYPQKRLLKSEEEQRAAKLARLRAAVQEGLDSAARGEGLAVVDVEAHFAEIHAEIDAELEAEAKATAAR